MGLNLIDLMKGYLTPDVISKASSFLSESEKDTNKAINTAIPSVLGGLLNKTSTEEGASAIWNLLTDGKHDGGILNNVLNIFNGGEATDSIMRSGASGLSSIFGEDKVGILSNFISNESGLQTGSANKLLKLVTPLLLGLIGKNTAGQGTAGLVNLLSGQKDFIKNVAPEGLAGLLGFSNFSSITHEVKQGIEDATTTVSNTVNDAVASVSSSAQTAINSTKETVEAIKENEGGIMKWLLPLLLIAGAVAAMLFLSKSCNKQPISNENTVIIDSSLSKTVTDSTANTQQILGSIDTLSGEWIYDNGAVTKIQLPNNAGILEVGENSTEAKLVAFLSGTELLDTVKGNWYDFTNVRFKTGSSDITPESMAQLKNLVAISKAFPTAQFKIGGYTDNTGDAAKNVILSQKRADAVAAQVIKLGAAKTSIVGAKGYGPEWPVADNATAEGRAQNRRVSVNVKAK